MSKTVEQTPITAALLHRTFFQLTITPTMPSVGTPSARLGGLLLPTFSAQWPRSRQPRQRLAALASAATGSPLLPGSAFAGGNSSGTTSQAFARSSWPEEKNLRQGIQVPLDSHPGRRAQCTLGSAGSGVAGKLRPHRSRHPSGPQRSCSGHVPGTRVDPEPVQQRRTRVCSMGVHFSREVDCSTLTPKFEASTTGDRSP